LEKRSGVFVVPVGSTLLALFLATGLQRTLQGDMGKFHHRKNSSVCQEIDHAFTGQFFGMPAYYNNTIYFGAVNDCLKAYSIKDARLVPEPTSKTSAHFAYPGATPSISANGSSEGIIWAVEARGSDAGILHAFDASNL
jgi:hypothetical protein